MADLIPVRPVHPGSILRRELAERKLSYAHFAVHAHMSARQVGDLCQQEADLTDTMAESIAQALDTSPVVWKNLMAEYKEAKRQKALAFLGELLDDTIEWSSTDTQHDLSPALKDILGTYLPEWLAESAKGPY